MPTLVLAALLAPIAAIVARRLWLDRQNDRATLRYETTPIVERGCIRFTRDDVSDELPRRRLPALPKDGIPLSPADRAAEIDRLSRAWRSEPADEPDYRRNA